MQAVNCDFDNVRMKCPRCGQQAPSRATRRACLPPSGQNRELAGGPGTELKKLLARAGIVAKPSCKCNRRAAEMDASGADWCEANLPTIVGWLQQESGVRRKRHAKATAAHEADPSQPAPEPMPLWLRVPFSAIAAQLLVLRAIRSARRNRSSAADVRSAV